MRLYVKGHGIMKEHGKCMTVEGSHCCIVGAEMFEVGLLRIYGDDCGVATLGHTQGYYNHA